jgi:hypothetical protein
MTPTIVPMQLGCCPASPRCALCGPADPVQPDVIEALVQAYAPRATEASPLQVAFFGGRPPTVDDVAAISGLPYRVRVRPDLLDRAGARRLADTGCIHVELDALSFHNEPVRAVGRTHGATLVNEMRAGLKALGMQVGVVLAPGLPGSSHEQSVADAEEAADFDTARLHPVLVLKGSGLHRAQMDGAYTPLTLSQAVTTCRAMLDVLESHHVNVLRVGRSPGPDGLGQAIGGPRHSSLRELVEARRTLDRLLLQAEPLPPDSHVVVSCAPADETRTRGPRNQHVRTLRARGGFASVHVVVDASLRRGESHVAVDGALRNGPRSV